MISISRLCLPLASALFLVAPYFAQADSGLNKPIRTATEAACHDEVCFDEVLKVGSKELNLLGVGKYEFFFFDVYTASFYAEQTCTIEQVLEPGQHKALILYYHREISPSKFIDVSTDTIRKGSPTLSQEVQSGLQMISEMFLPVQEGDRYVLTYEPDVGTKLYHNRELLGIIPGAEFAKAYFGIWLSKDSVSSSLRDELLAGL